MERNVYREPEDKVLLRTADVYQTEAQDDVTSYSDRLLSIVADFKNSGCPEGANAQSMVGKSKRGEVACRLFARIDPATGVIEAAGFKARGCLAMTACASAACLLIEGKPIEDALEVTTEEIRVFVDGVPAGKANALHFAACGIRALVGDFLAHDGASLAQLAEALPCDEGSISCIMAEHCSFRQTMLEMRADELEQAQALAEGNAYAACFDLVRKNSRNGKLTDPSDWEALVPEHLSCERFAEGIMSRLDEDCESPAPDAMAHRDRNGGIPARSERPSRFASRAVGIPSFAAVAPSEDLDDAAPSRHNTLDETEQALGAPVPGMASEHPEAHSDLELVEVEGEIKLVEASGSCQAEPRIADAAGIKLIRGKDRPYLYDGNTMTSSFARWAFLSAEDDPLTMFAYCVREESQTYPRPMAASSFANHPLDMDATTVDAVWERASKLPEYGDIRRISASNGDAYFFSSDHLSEEHAASLAEWESVERLWNV